MIITHLILIFLKQSETNKFYHVAPLPKGSNLKVPFNSACVLVGGSTQSPKVKQLTLGMLFP